jgi:hypothetical protein
MINKIAISNSHITIETSKHGPVVVVGIIPQGPNNKKAIYDDSYSNGFISHDNAVIGSVAPDYSPSSLTLTLNGVPIVDPTILIERRINRHMRYYLRQKNILVKHILTLDFGDSLVISATI